MVATINQVPCLSMNPGSSVLGHLREGILAEGVEVPAGIICQLPDGMEVPTGTIC